VTTDYCDVTSPYLFRTECCATNEYFVKVKFHYAIWFGAGLKQVRSWLQTGSKLVRTCRRPASNQLRTCLRPGSLSGSKLVRSWSRTCRRPASSC